MLPPGYEDYSKDFNQYGDYIIWKELLEECRKGGKSAVLISNDIKEDWVYKPKSILIKDSRKILNNARADIEVMLPQPFLEYEFNSVVGVDCQLAVVGIDVMSHLYSSHEYNRMGAERYQSFATSVKIQPQINPSYVVVNWFRKHRDEYNNAIKNIAYWQWSPSEIDIEALESYIEKVVPDIAIQDIDMSIVISELFL